MYDRINVLFVISQQLGRTFAIQELSEVRSVRNCASFQSEVLIFALHTVSLCITNPLIHVERYEARQKHLTMPSKYSTSKMRCAVYILLVICKQLKKSHNTISICTFVIRVHKVK